jgi:type VI secretion system protein ImpC
MKSLPWKITVLSDLGGHPAPPVRVCAEDLDERLRSVGVSAAVPVPGKGTTTLTPASLEDLSPAALRRTLGAVEGGPLDAMLHAPALQQLEAAWRGLARLLAEAGNDVEVEIASVPRASLAEHLRETVLTPGLSSDSPPTLLLLDFDFTHKPADLALMRELAGMAKLLQAPAVAAAGAGFFDLRHLAHVLTLPDMLGRLNDPAHAGWTAFQATEEARWFSLTINRHLERAPYLTEDYAEGVAEAKPETFLWARGGWLVAAALARSVRAFGHALDVSGGRGGRFDNLPVRPYPVAANETALLSTEVPMPDMKAQELSRAAFTPVIGQLRAGTAMIPIAVTVSRLAPGRLTVEGALAHQITAGRLARFCGVLLDAMPAGSPEEIAAYFRGELGAFLGPLGGDEAVSVAVTSAEGAEGPRAMAEIQIRSAVPLEGKPLSFTFLLPLERD